MIDCGFFSKTSSCFITNHRISKGKILMKYSGVFRKSEGSKNMTKSFPAVPDKEGERHVAQVITKKHHT
jgi:hypothetical protein